MSARKLTIGMIDFTDKCVVLKISDYRENDRLAKVLTATHGMVAVLLRGVKKTKAKLKPFAQEFAVFDTRLTANKGVFLTPIEPLLIQDGFSLCTDLKVFTAASVSAEATVAALGDDEPHTQVFVEFLKLLKELQPNCDPYYQAAVYMTRLLKLTGFYREYTYSDEPLTPVQMLGLAQKKGYEKAPDRDLSRRALKYICSEFQRNFDIGLKSVDSIDLYGK
ncbi:MAG: DNA repair protein RecO [Clostridiales bacterium]|nr:DNA repair protein RecO [Clostridiales bacterium]